MPREILKLFFGKIYVVPIFIALYIYGLRSGGENAAVMVETIVIMMTIILFLYTRPTRVESRSSLPLFTSFAVSTLLMGTHSLAVTAWTTMSQLNIIFSLMIIAICVAVTLGRLHGDVRRTR